MKDKLFHETLIKPSVELLISVAVLMLLVFCLDAFGATVDMEKIEAIESSGRVDATGEAGEVGLFQLTNDVFQDFMRVNNCVILAQDMYEPLINTAVAKWYLTEEIPRLLTHYGVPVTETNIIAAYNAGARHIALYGIPKQTRNHLAKYYK